MGAKTLITLEQFEQLPPQEDKLFELDEGELRVISPGRPRHNRVRERLAYRLIHFMKNHELGEIFVETEFRLSADTVRIPDVAFVPMDRVNAINLDRPIEGAPDLAMEVVSPNDLAEELARKVDQYLAGGSQAVWVLYPVLREVHTYQAGRINTTLGDTDVLEDAKLLPGFSVLVKDLFE